MKKLNIDLRKLYHIDEKVQVVNLLRYSNDGSRDDTKSRFENEIELSITTFPDKQKTIRLYNLDFKRPVIVLCRIVTGDDLINLGKICDILNRNVVNYKIVITYLSSARSDRLFNSLQSVDLKVVVAALDTFCIESCGVYILDTHNFKAVQRMSRKPSLYTNISVYEDENHGNSVSIYTDIFANVFGLENRNRIVVVYPDKGSSRTKVWGCDTITFDKERNIETGEIISFKPIQYKQKDEHRIILSPSPRTVVETSEEDIIKTVKLFNNVEYVVVDDLCDGGSTFINIAKWFENNGVNPKERISLITPHMVQEWGVNRMCNTFKNVITTDSYDLWSKKIDRDNLIVATLY